MMLQSNLFKQPPLEDNHSSKSTNAESAQANFHAIVTVEDDLLSNATSDHFCYPNLKNLSETTTTKLYLEYCALGYQSPSKTPPHLSCQAHLKSANCLSPLFRQSPPLYIGFSWAPPLKVRFFSEPLNINIFHP